ncbi:MAG: hypothetical protein AB7O97_22255 [Planctomycetota bacterium]
MDLVLLSNRGGDGAPHWSRAAAGAVAAALAADGVRPRWLCALGEGEAAPTVPAGVDLDLLRGRRPAFRRVVARVSDVDIEVALARTLRPLRRPVVVHFGFGAPGSTASLWLAERMGGRGMAVVRATEVLCHRGTLVDHAGSPCAEFDDPRRCARCCCCGAAAEGLAPQQARLARLLRWLGPYSPYPNELAFRSRGDLVLSSLQLATVLVPSDDDRALLQRAGLSARSLAVVDGTAAAAVVTAILELAAARVQVAGPG